MPKKPGSHTFKRNKLALAAKKRWKKLKALADTKPSADDVNTEKEHENEASTETSITTETISRAETEVEQASTVLISTTPEPNVKNKTGIKSPLQPLEDVWNSSDSNEFVQFDGEIPSTSGQSKGNEFVQFDGEIPSTSGQSEDNDTSGQIKPNSENDDDISNIWGTDEEYAEIMKEKLCVERTRSNQSELLSGNRMVEIGYTINWCLQLSRQHAQICTLGKLEVANETRSGLVSIITLKCNTCNKTYKHQTEDPKKNTSAINTGAVWGTLATGSTYKHMEEFLSVLNIPCMSNTLFYSIQDKLGDMWMKSCWTEMERTGVEERRIAIENGNIDKDGVPWVTVFLDGGWSKRSYGHSYNAASGVAVIIGRATGKVVYMGVRNKFCIICARAENKNITPNDHLCFKNWTGSSTAMEPDIIVEGFCKSEELHGIRYKQFIADGDSSVYAKIQANVPYGKEVLKIECTNHVLKNYGKRLYAIKKNTTSISLIARRLLTLEKISQLQKTAQKAIYDNAHGDVGTLIEDLENGPLHVFNDHKACKDYYCSYVGEIINSEMPKARATGLYRHIHGAIGLVIRKANFLIDQETNNRAETFMNILARFNMGKRLNLIQRGSFQTRSYLSVLRYNKGFDWHASPWKHATGESPGVYFKKFMRTQKKYKRKLVYPDPVSVKRKKRKEKKTSKPDQDYGPMAVQPKLTEVEIDKECQRILKQLKVTEEERNEIAQNTVGQFDNTLYKLQRRDRLTASNFGAVMKRKDHTSCHSLVKTILTTTDFTTSAMEYGKINESVAISVFEEKLGIKVEPTGLYIDVQDSFLAASPDGLIGEDYTVEVKCLHKVSQLGISLEEATKKINNCCLELHHGNLRLKRQHNYYYQVQGQLNITGRKICYFIVFVNDKTDLFIEEIKKDNSLWEDHMKKKLLKFYTQCVLPEIVRGNLKRGLRCVDPQYIVEAKTKHQMNLANKIKQSQRKYNKLKTVKKKKVGV